MNLGLAEQSITPPCCMASLGRAGYSTTKKILQHSSVGADIHKLYHIRKSVTNHSNQVNAALGSRCKGSTSLKARLHMAPKHGLGGDTVVCWSWLLRLVPAILIMSLVCRYGLWSRLVELNYLATY